MMSPTAARRLCCGSSSAAGWPAPPAPSSRGGRWRPPTCPPPRPEGAFSGFRQRNEFRFAGHRRETALLPVFLGLLDAILPAGDEVPPEMAGAVEGLAAEKQEARRRGRADRERAAGGEDQEAAGREGVAVDLDGAVEQIGGALGVLGIEQQRRAGGQSGGGVEEIRE